MKNYSLIYSESGLPEDQLKDAGWFDAPAFNVIGHCVNYVKFFSDELPKTNDRTTFGYFPGAFTIIHDGHIHVMLEFLRNFPDAILVIAPANTDYLVEKYSKDNPYIANQGRYDRLVEAIERNFNDSDRARILIDLNPMLNNYTDHNFTDLFDDFLWRQKCILEDMRVPQYIIAGKDRQFFRNIEKLTDTLKVFYVDSYRDLSSRELMKLYPVEKKDLILRVDGRSEYELFKSFFGNEYKSITPSYLSDELQWASLAAKGRNNVVTICKEYKNILPYVKMSRYYVNPFEQAGYQVHLPDNLYDCTVVDSDSYSGGTKEFLEIRGCTVLTYHNLYGRMGEIELLDIWDFYEGSYGYPYYDIAERCSMRPFTKSTHDRFSEFKKELKNL